MSVALALDNGFVVNAISPNDRIYRIGTLNPEAQNVNWDNHIYQYDAVSKAMSPILNGLTRSKKNKIVGQLVNLTDGDSLIVRGPDQRHS